MEDKLNLTDGERGLNQIQVYKETLTSHHRLNNIFQKAHSILNNTIVCIFPPILVLASFQVVEGCAKGGGRGRYRKPNRDLSMEKVDRGGKITGDQ